MGSRSRSTKQAPESSLAFGGDDPDYGASILFATGS